MVDWVKDSGDDWSPSTSNNSQSCDAQQVEFEPESISTDEISSTSSSVNVRTMKK